VESVDHLTMTVLLKHCSGVITDSSGIQREAFFLGKYCAVLRKTSEFPYTVTRSAGAYVDGDEDLIRTALEEMRPERRDVETDLSEFGAGSAAARISAAISVAANGHSPFR
jgi:UDP-GlcNAc3NAcA epimerase